MQRICTKCGGLLIGERPMDFYLDAFRSGYEAARSACVQTAIENQNQRRRATWRRYSDQISR